MYDMLHMRSAVAGAVLAAMLCAARAHAQPIPASEWTPEARLWMARAAVAEAGWDSATDHAALAWVLARRWDRMRARWPALSLVTVIRAYCAGLGRYPAVTARQEWVRSLPWGDPPGWLRRYAERWRRVRDTVDAWGRGAVVDPCKGDAMHWGGTIDRPPPSWRALPCGETANTYYALR